MNKLFAALIAAVFTLCSVAALAQTTPAERQQYLQEQGAKATNNPPATPEETKALKAAREKALMDKAEFAKMSPAEQAAFKKGRAAQRQMDLEEQGKLATELPPTTPEQQKALNAQKGTPKALPTAAQRQNALTGQEDAAKKGGGGN